MNNEEVKAHFKGPGEWRSQAANLEIDDLNELDDYTDGEPVDTRKKSE